ncbi:MAG: carboxypeptidase regulatory-like domain-containing protein [Thermoanaerobaculia bacterium]
MNRITNRTLRGLRILLALALAWTAVPAAAQTTTGTLRGVVKDETGAALPGVTVEAVNDASGLTRSAVSGPDGFYNISVTPGTYSVKASLEGLGADSKNVVVLLGQTQGLDFLLSLRAAEAVTVTATAPVIETRQSEIATNVTEQQLRTLPQDNRNFLNFANLAPGVRTATDEEHKEVLGGALPGFNTNVFIDGTSYKNDVLNGGVVGQDSSRGNPFPQNAVQEFRVVTQNFKAEYEKSSSAIITAVTKSGGNTFHGDGFADYQAKGLVATNECDLMRNRCSSDPNPDFVKPDYTRWQAGVSLGGPIIQDKLHFFGSWEYNTQNRNNAVSPGAQIDLVPEPTRTELLSLTGVAASPFKSNLAFSKISWQATSADVVDFTGFYRHENEVKDVGGQRAFQAGTDIKNGVWNVQARNSWLSTSFLNETIVGYQDYKWNPSPVEAGIVGQDFQNALYIGSTQNLQNFNQKRFSVRNDFTLLDIRAAGDHVVKVGVIYSHNKYDVQKQFFGIPIYRYRSDIPAGSPYAFPFEAQFGFGNPDLSITNNQFGTYLQDDWTINPQLTVNIGLRWDVESNGLNNKYVTPALVVSELSDRYSSDFFTNGNDRPAYKNSFQPRIGFAYDLSKKGTTVFFGGYGRYTDRVEYNALLDEQFRLQYTTLTFRFSADGQPRDGNPTLMWDDSYLTAAGLQTIIDSPARPNPEVFLVNNNTKPPVSDQFTGGIRQQLGPIGVSLSYAGVRSKNGFTWIFGNRRADGGCCESVSPFFSNVLLADPTKRAWYDAGFLQVDKAYTASSKWGATLAYTYGRATANGGDFFTLDWVDVSASPRRRAPQDERHRVVVSGIVGLPWDVTLSTLVQIGTGTPFNVFDATDGFGPNQFKVRLGGGQPEGTLPFQQWDVSLQKQFYFTQAAYVGVRAGVFNVTNHKNFGCFEGFIPPAGETNPNFGKPDCLITQPRRLQVGLNVGF